MNAETITGLVLAGGLGRRMGGVDKGLQIMQGKPLVSWVIERLQPQVDALLINANQNLDRYREFGHPVITDQVSGFAGPLAGLQAGLTVCTTPLLVTVPCDSPFLPTDLVARLRAELTRTNAQLAVAKTGEQAHPVFCLTRREVVGGLTEFLAAGGRKIDAWYAGLAVVEVAFDDEAEGFANINTPQELNAFSGARRQ